MKQKLTTIGLLICLMASAIYSVVSLNLSDSPSFTEHSPTSMSHSKRSAFEAYRSPPDTWPAANTEQKRVEYLPSSENVISFPFQLRLIGTKMAYPPLALVETKGVASELKVGDLLFNWPIQLISIEPKSISMEFEGKLFHFELTGPNLLAQSTQRGTNDVINPYTMDSEAIGNRPKIIEHVVSLTATDFIADGMLAKPGISERLFRQAGLKEDDLIKRINGKSVTIEAQREELQRTIQYADTLVFEVERKGKTLTLYLDIPSEALTLKR